MSITQYFDDEEIHVKPEIRKPINIVNQAFEELCHICFAAGECTCDLSEDIERK